MKPIIISTLFLFIVTLSHSQNFQIKEMGVLKGDFIFDTLKTKKNHTEIIVFFKKNEIPTNKKIKEYPLYNDTIFNKIVFIKKLNFLLQNSSLYKDLIVKIYELPEDQLYFSLNKNKAVIANFTAILVGYDTFLFENEMDFFEYLQSLNKTSKKNINTHGQIPVKSIFEFERKIRKQDQKNILLPSNIFILNKDSVNMNISCPALDIPEEDIFLSHLTLLFRPNLVMNRLVKIIQKDKYGITIDSLKQILENQKNEIEKIKNKKFYHDNRLSLTSSYSLFNISSSRNDLSSSLKTGFFNVFGISYSRTITSGLGIGIGLNSLNASGTLNNNELEVIHQEVLPSSTVVMNKKTNILNLTENWNLDNAIGLNLGFNFKKAIGKKVNLFMDIQLGRILNANIRTTLQEGVFNYRASIPGIEDEIINVASLDLKENVTYSDKFKQNFGFNGGSLSIRADVEYTFYKNIFVIGGFQFDYYKLKNSDYNSESKVSTSLGEFNSSFNNVKSITLLPFSIGLGVGIKF
jgi:hypothetical protein